MNVERSQREGILNEKIIKLIDLNLLLLWMCGSYVVCNTTKCYYTLQSPNCVLHERSFCFYCVPVIKRRPLHRKWNRKISSPKHTLTKKCTENMWFNRFQILIYARFIVQETRCFRIQLNLIDFMLTTIWYLFLLKFFMIAIEHAFVGAREWESGSVGR